MTATKLCLNTNYQQDQNYIAAVARVLSGDDLYEMKIPSMLLSFLDIWNWYLIVNDLFLEINGWMD